MNRIPHVLIVSGTELTFHVNGIISCVEAWTAPHPIFPHHYLRIIGLSQQFRADHTKTTEDGHTSLTPTLEKHTICYHLAVYALTVRQPAYLDGLLAVLVGCAPVGCVLPMDSSQEVQLDGVLGHPILELVEELTAAGQAQAPLIQLDIRQTFEMENQ